MAGFWGNVGRFFGGTPSSISQQSTLNPQQQQLLQQQLQAVQGRGAQGASGDVADYYRDLLGNNSSDYDAFAAPEMRQFQEEIVPELSEQFAGLGAGGSGLGGSNFRNAATNAGASLSERLGAIRAQLRQRGAEGLQQISQNGLNQYNENIFRPREPGLIESVAPAAAQGAVGYFAPWAKPFAGNDAQKGSSNPYGGQLASPINPNGVSYNPYTGQQGNKFLG